MNLCLRKLQLTKIISQQITKFSIIWVFTLLLGSLLYFSEGFDFDFANPTGISLHRVLLDEPEKFEEKFLFKADRGNKMYTMKDHSLNSITCDYNGAYTQKRTANANHFVTRKSKSTEMKV